MHLAWAGASPLILLAGLSEQLIRLRLPDVAVIVIYFLFVLGIGLYLKRYTSHGEDFFLAGRSTTAWVAGISFVAANLGTLELMGWAAATYEYGIITAHWYWIGAIPAMVFLGLFMFADNPMGIHWVALVFGLGAIGSFGYWTTDFLVVQRALSARNLTEARLAPIIGSFFKMSVPFIVILPGLLSLALLPFPLVAESAAQAGQHTYNEVLPLMLVRYCGPGLLGLGVIALIAGFMSGMAGNVSAFSTVWTYDIYRQLIRKNAPDEHYVAMGRWCSILGVTVSLFTRPKPVEELTGLVYGRTPLPDEGRVPVYRRPVFWAGVSLAIFLVLQYFFW